MSTVREIEAAIAKLNPEEVEAVAKWLEEFREEMWDRKLEADAKAGRLDNLLEQAKQDYRAGKGKQFP